MRKWFLAILLLLLAMPVMAQSEQEEVYVRAAHFSADAPAVDVYLNGELVLETFSFPELSDWFTLTPDTYLLDIVVAGQAPENVILSAEYTLAAGDWLTIAVIGLVEANNLSVQAITENVNLTEADFAPVTVVHAIPGLEAVQIVADENLLAENLSYPDEVSSGYASLELPTDEYVFDIQDNAGVSLLITDTLAINAGRSYLVALVGTIDNPSLVLLSTDLATQTTNNGDLLAEIETGEGTSMVRIGHFSVSAPEIDIYLNDEMVLEATEFGTLSSYRELSAGLYSIALVPTGEVLANAIYQGQVALVADSLTLIAVIGFAENQTLQVVTAQEDNTPPREGISRIAYFQAIPGVELFDLNANGNTLIQGVPYPNAFLGALDGYVSVDIVANVYEFVVEGAGNTLNVGNVTTGSQRIYLIVSAGTETTPIFFLISSEFPEELSETP
ncbi:MAG: DUF4397 domain-containing protein [Anaerolineae bacterium]